ncbi:MAG: hypothetical protein GXY77_07705 [Fibrobacter sp.]|nr:hypothetical protein [Fibrobacter sp.]
MRDYGTGIPKELLTRIFDPFFTTKTNGHGIGLATCYSIINQHNGCIDVQSREGKGTTFTIYLPAASEFVSNPETENNVINSQRTRNIPRYG